MSGNLHYILISILLMVGLYVMISHKNLFKKMIGLSVFQAAVILVYVTLGKIEGGTAPILGEGFETFSSPLPHVLMLTAIVVGVATMAVGMALIVRIHEAYGTIEDDEIYQQETSH